MGCIMLFGNDVVVVDDDDDWQWDWIESEKSKIKTLQKFSTSSPSTA